MRISVTELLQQVYEEVDGNGAAGKTSRIQVRCLDSTGEPFEIVGVELERERGHDEPDVLWLKLEPFE